MTGPAPFVIGLTGSIGMGKTTTAQMFADAGIPVWDADAAVARLYEKGGAGTAAIKNLRPGAIKDGVVDRKDMRQWVAHDPTALKKIETVIHPLVAMGRQEFLRDTDAPIVLLDIPLLYETGAESQVDMVVVVSTGPDTDIQRDRVLSRPGMTEELFQSILAKQMPDATKRSRADIVIPTLSMEGAKIAVEAVISQIREKLRNA